MEEVRREFDESDFYNLLAVAGDQGLQRKM